MKSIGPIKTVDLYITKEVLMPFIVGVAIIGVIMLSGFLFELTDLIIVRNIPLTLVLRLLVYKLPEIIVQTFPIAILFATMLAMGRLSRENEFTALRMGGISLYRFMIPLLILGILVSGMTYLFNEHLVPWANHEAQNIIRRSILQEVMPQVQDGVFFKGPQGRLFYVEEYNRDAGILNKIVIYDFPERGNYPHIITAEQGRVMEGGWQLREGIIHEYDSQGHLTLETQFGRMDIELVRDLENFYGEQRTTSEMSREQLKREIRLFQDSGLNVDSLLVDYHLKLATPLIALIFILLGTPLSLSSDSKAAGVVFTIIIVFLYYLLQSVARSLGRNGLLTPLMAAWLPNLIFGVIGIILLLWRQHWENWAKKLLATILPVFLIIIIFSSAPAQAEDSLRLQAEQLEYSYDGRKMEITDQVTGQYGAFNIITDKIIIKFDDGSEKVYNVPQEILMDKSKFSGCDFEEPHYYFEASEVTIYPGDYLVAKHVFFKELNGKLPLFYWPYLYISLKDEPQHLIPRVGYSARRGWFLKNTYYYWWQQLPGELYLDYYTVSGFAGGAKQHFIHQPNRKGFFRFYAQENRTDLSGLFRWQANLEYFNYQGAWNNELDLEYTRYQDYDTLIGESAVSREQEDWEFSFGTELDYKDYFETDSDDEIELGVDFDYWQQLSEALSVKLDYEHDYLLSSEEDAQSRWQAQSSLFSERERMSSELTLSAEESSFNSEDLELGLDTGHEQQLSDTVGLRLNYDRGLLIEEEGAEQTRWGAEGALTKELENLDLELVMERYDPGFDEEDGVRFYRWPEFNTTYYPYQAAILEDMELGWSLGHYYEYQDQVKAYRSLGSINYDNRWNLHDRISLKTSQTVAVSAYLIRKGPDDLRYQEGYFDMGQDTYESQTRLITDLTRHLSWNNYYQYSNYWGESPFDFDSGDLKDEIESKLDYRRGRFSWELGSGYDLLSEEYSPLRGIARWRDQKLRMSVGTTYDPQEGEFSSDLVATSDYQGEKLEHKTAFRYDLNNSQWRRWDNTLAYEVNDKFYLEFNNSHDFEKDRIREANIVIARNFHCRELRLSYDYLEREIMLEYRLNIFPEQRLQFGRSDDEPFMFDTGIRELMDEED